MRPTLLIVDDEVRGLEALERILEDEFEILTATNARAAEEIMAREWVQLVLCGLSANTADT